MQEERGDEKKEREEVKTGMREDQKWSEEAYGAGRARGGGGGWEISKKKKMHGFYFIYFLKHKTTTTLDRFGSY